MRYLSKFLKPRFPEQNRETRRFMKEFKKLAKDLGVNKVSFRDSEISLYEVDRGGNLDVRWDEDDDKTTFVVTRTELWVHRSYPEGRLPLHLLAALSFHELAHYFQAMRGEIAGANLDDPKTLGELERKATEFALRRLGPSIAGRIGVGADGHSIDIPIEELW